MNGKQYFESISRTTAAALKSNEISLPEILGALQMCAINTERRCYEHAMAEENGAPKIVAAHALPAGVLKLPGK